MKTKAAALTIVVVLGLVACGASLPKGPYAAADQRHTEATDQCIRTGDKLNESTWVVVFFPDRKAWYAVPEFRLVPTPVQSDVLTMAGLAFRELFAGPVDNASLLPVIPAETELLNIDLEGTILHVDLSQEFVSNHPGGSTWELFVLRSVVNTMLELRGVEQVQLLVEGKRVESLAGHLAIDRPLARDPVEKGPARLDYDRAEHLQQLADDGVERWRTEPGAVVCRESRAFGFSSEDQFELLEHRLFPPGNESSSQALYRVMRGAQEYRLELVQPVTNGTEGIWMISAVSQADSSR